MFKITLVGDPQDWRFKSVVYEEDGLQLTIPVEARDGSQKTYLASSDPSVWNTQPPKSLSISEAELAISRIINWGSSVDVKFVFGRGQNKEETVKKYKDLGWTVVTNSDGSISCLPPKRVSKSQ